MLSDLDPDELLNRKIDLTIQRALNASSVLPKTQSLQNRATSLPIEFDWTLNEAGEVEEFLRCDSQPISDAGLAP